MTERVSIRLSMDHMEKLTTLARQHSLSVSDMVRLALLRFCENLPAVSDGIPEPPNRCDQPGPPPVGACPAPVTYAGLLQRIQARLGQQATRQDPPAPEPNSVRCAGGMPG